MAVWLSARSGTTKLSPGAGVQHAHLPLMKGKRKVTITSLPAPRWCSGEPWVALLPLPNLPAFSTGQRVVCLGNKFWNLISSSGIHGWAHLPFPWAPPQITQEHLVLSKRKWWSTWRGITLQPWGNPWDLLTHADTLWKTPPVRLHTIKKKKKKTLPKKCHTHPFWKVGEPRGIFLKPLWEESPRVS